MAAIIFWGSFLAAVYAYVGYLLLCMLAARVFGKKFKREEIFPALTLVIPCYNEELVIRKKIENSLELDYPQDKLQIIVVSESTDRTNDIISDFKQKNVELYTLGQRAGKTVLMFCASLKARGRIIVFSDANVRLKSDALKQIASNFSDERVGAVTGLLQVSNPQVSAISRGEFMYKKYESLLRTANGRMGRVLNSDGALFAIRKDLYLPITPERGDDFELVVRVLLEGYDSVFDPEAISYEDSSVTAKQEIQRKIRMVSWFFKSTALLIQEMLVRSRFDLIFQIVSHKVLRWLTPYFFILFLFSNVFLWQEGWFYQLLLCMQVLGYMLGAAGFYIAEIKKIKPPFILGVFHYFLMYNYAFLAGTIKGLFPARTTSSWAKARP